MLYTYKIATLNINGIVSNTRIGMLEDFLKRQDFDIALLQEVTHANFTTIRRYTAYVNERTVRTLHNHKRLPSGRGISAMYKGIWILNICASSGVEKRRERETFYNRNITFLLPPTPKDMILAGDFNCVISTADCTRQINFSQALVILIQGLDLHDVWETSSSWPIYTYYTTAGASRIDRIYVTESLRRLWRLPLRTFSQ
jgi:exonuclease III